MADLIYGRGLTEIIGEMQFYMQMLKLSNCIHVLDHNCYS